MPTYPAPAPLYVGPPKWHGSDRNKPINRIVIHATVGQEPAVKGAARATVAMSKRTERPSSYHYIADSAEVLQYVYDSVVAYGAPPNEHSLHFELCCSLAGEGKGHWERADHQAMLKRAAVTVAGLCLAYDVPIVKLGPGDLKAGKRGICGHIDVSNAWGQTTHWDPGPHFPWGQFLALVRAEADKVRRGQPSRSHSPPGAAAAAAAARRRHPRRPRTPVRPRHRPRRRLERRHQHPGRPRRHGDLPDRGVPRQPRPRRHPEGLGRGPRGRGRSQRVRPALGPQGLDRRQRAATPPSSAARSTTAQSGAAAPTVHAFTQPLRHTETGQVVLFTVVHLPSNIQGGPKDVIAGPRPGPDPREAVTEDAIANMGKAWQLGRQRHPGSARVLVGDWNLDYRPAVRARLVGHHVPDARLLLGGTPPGPRHPREAGHRLGRSLPALRGHRRRGAGPGPGPRPPRLHRPRHHAGRVVNLDGRFDPLTVLAQGLALVGVLVTAAVAWVRHERPAPTPHATFYEPRTIETPHPTWRSL